MASGAVPDPATPRSRDFLFPESPVRGALTNALLLGARLYSGLTIASAGLDKLPTPPWMVDQVRELGLGSGAGTLATLACLGEFVGGLLLALGLFTRPASIVLAIVMGVAAFAYHRVPPLVGMHIAQHFFWLFLIFAAIGAGRFSLDHWARRRIETSADRGRATRSALSRTLPILTLIAAVGGYREFLVPAPSEASASDLQITSMSVPGSFNQWNLKANALSRTGETIWEGVVEIGEPGPVEFKFAANGSWESSLGDHQQNSRELPLSDQGTPNGPNIKAILPEAGRYRFRIDTKNNEYSVAPETAASP